MAAPPRRGSILPAATRDRMWKWIEHSIRSKGLCTLAGPIGCEGVGIRSQCFCTIAGPLAERAKPQGPLTRLWAPSDALPVGLLEASVDIARRSQVGVSRKRSLQEVHHHPTPTINPPHTPTRIRSLPGAVDRCRVAGSRSIVGAVQHQKGERSIGSGAFGQVIIGTRRVDGRNYALRHVDSRDEEWKREYD